MTLFGHALRRLRGQILAFGLGLALWGTVYVFLFPVVQESMSDIDYPPEILAAFGAGGNDLSDPRLFFDVEFFALVPSITAVFAVIAGTAALAGEESGGTIEFLASLPLSRRRLFLQKALAVAAGALLVAAITSLCWIVTSPFAEYTDVLPVRDLVGATFIQVPWVLFVAAVALLLGAVAPSRSSAAAWTGATLVASYLIVAIASVTERVEWMRYMSPYYYTDLPGILEDGLTADHQLVLWGGILVVVVAALRAFEGRELGLDHWQWHALFAGPSRVGPSLVGPGAPGARSGLTSASAVRPPTSPRGWALLLAMLALVGAVAGAGVATMRSSADAPGQRDGLHVTGRLDADGARLLAPTSGNVHSVLAQQGATVERGQVLAWLTSSLDASRQPLVAPFAGSLTEFSLTPGQSMLAGTPVGEIHRTTDLRIVFEVGERDLKSIDVGDAVEATVTALGAQIATRVESIRQVPVSEVGTGRTKPKYEVWCPLPDPDARMVIGMRVEGTLLTD